MIRELTWVQPQPTEWVLSILSQNLHHGKLWDWVVQQKFCVRLMGIFTQSAAQKMASKFRVLGQ
jgi:hypothetical protein